MIDVIEASNTARKRAVYLISQQLDGKVGRSGCFLGVPTWCDLNGFNRRVFYQKNSGMSLRVLLKTAELLDCSVDYLLGRTDTKEVNK